MSISPTSTVLTEVEFERLASVMDRAGEAWICLSRDARISYANEAAARLAGRDLGELVGLAVLDLDPTASEAVREGWHEVASTSRTTFESNLYPVSITSCPVVVHSSRIDASDDVFVLLLLEDRDGDAGASAFLERVVRRTQRPEAVTTLTAGVAKELNNLLTGILGYAELLDEVTTENDEVRRYARELVRAALQARDLMTLTLRLTRGDRDSDGRAISESLAAAKDLLRAAAGPGVEIDFRLNARGLIGDDGGEMPAAVLHLVGNASDAARAGGRHVVVSTDDVWSSDPFDAGSGELPAGTYVAVTVEDDGPGIEPTLRERIFEPFVTTKSERLGTGLGLPIVLSVVRSLQGEIHVDDRPGGGTVVRLYLPTQSPRAPSAAPVVHGRALVVDDQAQVAAVVALHLESLGFDCTTAASGEEAIAIVDDADAPFDVILTDLAMPGIDGIEFAKGVRQRYPQTPVVLMSGFAQPDLDGRQAELFQRVLAKPFRRSDLEELVSSLIEA